MAKGAVTGSVAPLIRAGRDGRMAILQPRDADAVKRRFDAELKRDVTLTLYTQPVTRLYIPGRDCQTCGQTQQLVQELSDLSRRLSLDVVDYYSNHEDAASRGIEMIPALTVGADGNDGARFYGLPSGREFPALLDTIVAASSRQRTLELETRMQLKRLPEDVHIQVFVTPTCSYSPALARLAHAMALESPRVIADVVEVQEFPHLGRLYGVMSVPKTVINETVQFVGAVPESVLVQRVLQAVGASDETEADTTQVTAQTTPVS